MLDFLFGNKGKDIKALLYSSLKLFGEGDVRIPSFRRLWLATFNRLYVLSTIWLIVYTSRVTLEVYMIMAGFLILLPFSFFYDVRMKACQTWMVYAAITRGSSSLREANESARKVKWSLRLFALMEFLFATAGGAESSEGILGLLARALASTLEPVFDVVEDYLLPAIVIEQKSVAEVGKRLADLKKNVPAVLTGAFGLDLFGDVASSLTWYFHLALFGCGLVVGLASAPYLPESVLTPVPFAFAVPALPRYICLVPVFVCIVTSSLLNRTLKIFVSSLKDIYFSVFYTSINRPLEIRQDLRETVTNYLHLQDASYLQSVKATLAQKFPTLTGTAAVAVTEAAASETIAKVFQDALSDGRSPEQIRDFLKSKGYADAQIQPILEKHQKPQFQGG